MLQLLAMAQRPLCACELESPFDLSQPTISHHLRILREVGIVNTTRKGTWIFYELNPGPLKLLRKLETLLTAEAHESGHDAKDHAETQHE